MIFSILGSGAVGGYYGAKLVRAGHDVTFIARGAHLAAIRDRGLEIRSPALGDFVVQARAEEDTSLVGPVDVVIVAVKAYDNASALDLIAPMVGPNTTVLPLQNGVDSVDELATRLGQTPIVGGVTYVATALTAPGVIDQTGTHRRIVFGEVFGSPPRLTERIGSYVDGIPKSMRSSLLIDLAQGKRIEVEQLQGSVVRRAARAGIHVPIMSTLYSVLKPWANGARQSD